MNKKTLLSVISVAVALVIWQIVSVCVGNELLLASPVNVAVRLTSVWKENDFWTAVSNSFFRISAGFLLAFLAGFIIGVAAGVFRILEIFLQPYVVAVKTVPVASFIIMCLMWMNYQQMTILISFLIAFPVVYSNVLQGMKSADENKKEMCRLYNVPWRRRLLYVYLPSVKPYIISASGVAAGMAWKAGVAAEVIGVIDGSIGEKLYNAKIYLQNADLLCWTLIIIILSVATEKLFALLLKFAFKGVEKL